MCTQHKILPWCIEHCQQPLPAFLGFMASLVGVVVAWEKRCPSPCLSVAQTHVAQSFP